MMMGTRLLALGALAAAAACSPGRGDAGTLSADDLSALRAIAEQDTRIVLARDWTTLTARFAPDAVRMPPNSPAIQGREAIRQFLEAMPPISAFNFRMLDLQGDGHMAYMRAAWSITVAPPGVAAVSDSGKILIVFEKQSDGTWLTVADAWNSDLPASR